MRVLSTEKLWPWITIDWTRGDGSRFDFQRYKIEYDYEFLSHTKNKHIKLKKKGIIYFGTLVIRYGDGEQQWIEN